MPKILVIYGPNLNLLGSREPQIYGRQPLEDVNARVWAVAQSLGVDVEFFQSNHEGVLIDKLHEARTTCQAVVINPGGLAHTSVVLRDAIAAIDIPVIECHSSNVARREDFRQRSLISGVCVGVIFGLGPDSMVLGVRAAEAIIQKGGR